MSSVQLQSLHRDADHRAQERAVRAARQSAAPQPDDGHTLDWIIAEPVIGHLKDDHRMRRNPLKGRDGDRINAVLAAAGYNFSLLLRWFEELLRALFLVLGRAPWMPLRLTQRPETFFTDDQGRGGWQTVDALKKRGRQEAASKPLEPLASYAAALRRRLARASSPPAASISPGTPAPTMGPGTA